MKLMGLISSPGDPASRFRIAQYKDTLNALGTSLDLITASPPKESDPPWWTLRNKKYWRTLQIRGREKLLRIQRQYDIIWQNRLLLYESCLIESRYTKPFVLDLDDAVWLTEGKQAVNTVIQKAEMVFAGNEYIAAYCIGINKQVKLVPSVIDTNLYKPAAVPDRPFTIGWIGTPSNLKYLEQVRQPLLAFLQENKDSRLVIVSGERPEGFSGISDRVQFVPWSREREIELINSFDAGLMPLPDDEWTRGKCGFKLLQYMACGIACLASPVGVNRNIIEGSGAGIAVTDHREWQQALTTLYRDPDTRRQMAGRGRPYVEAHYSCDKWAPVINRYFQQLVR